MTPERYDDVTERTLRLVRETVDDTTAYVPDDDGVTAEHLCPPMSVRERRAVPRPEPVSFIDPGAPCGCSVCQKSRAMSSAVTLWPGMNVPDYGVPNVAPRIPRQREGINVGKLLAVLGVMVGGAALLVGVVVWYVAIGFRMLP